MRLEFFIKFECKINTQLVLNVLCLMEFVTSPITEFEAAIWVR